MINDKCSEVYCKSYMEKIEKVLEGKWNLKAVAFTEEWLRSQVEDCTKCVRICEEKEWPNSYCAKQTRQTRDKLLTLIARMNNKL